VQFHLRFGPRHFAQPHEESLLLGARRLRLHLVHNPGARRYILRLRRDGTARLTIPRGGSKAEARHFAYNHAAWLVQQFLCLAI